jgi:peptidoglycan/LPS O-acetylase OafA/YrhL
VLCFAAFVVGPLMTSKPLAEYLADVQTYKYLAGINMVLLPPNLPGVFTDNPYAPVVNGSLWTLWYEVQCYLVVAALGVAGLLKRRPVLLLMGAAAAAMPFVEGPAYLRAELFLFFGGGMCLHLFRDHIRADRRLAWPAAAVLAVALLSGTGFSYAFAAAGTYLVFCAAYAPWGRLAGFGRRGDVSYGIYVYAFPIQQSLVQVSGGQMAWWANALLAFPITLVLAHASWRWVEAPALAWKDRPLRTLLPSRLRPPRIAVDG